QKLSYVSALLTAQAILNTREIGELRLSLVTRGAQGTGEPSEKINLAQSPIWGLGQSLVLEHPELQCLSADLDPGASPPEAGSLLREILSSDGEEQIALRSGKRLSARLSKCTSVSKEMKPETIRSDASYLVTGGLGGLGLEVARWLSK